MDADGYSIPMEEQHADLKHADSNNSIPPPPPPMPPVATVESDDLASPDGGETEGQQQLPGFADRTSPAGTEPMAQDVPVGGGGGDAEADYGGGDAGQGYDYGGAQDEKTAGDVVMDQKPEGNGRLACSLVVMLTRAGVCA